jgi:hypothetical protein
MQVTSVTSKSLMGIRGSCFDVRIEYNKDFVIIHLPLIDKMTKGVFFEMKTLLKDWWEFVDTMGYKAIFAAAPIEDSKINKLLIMLNFMPLDISEGYLVYKYKEA